MEGINLDLLFGLFVIPIIFCFFLALIICILFMGFHFMYEKVKPFRNTFFLSFFCFFLGYIWMFEYKKYGYYIDGRNLVTIHGEQGLITIYALLFFGYSFLAYGLYQTVRALFKEYKKNKSA